jgi:hypothetical protein
VDVRNAARTTAFGSAFISHLSLLQHCRYVLQSIAIVSLRGIAGNIRHPRTADSAEYRAISVAWML